MVASDKAGICYCNINSLQPNKCFGQRRTIISMTELRTVYLLYQSSSQQSKATMDMAKNTITEATKLILNNKTCMLKLVSFLLVVPLFLLNLLHSLVARPLLQRVEEAYETSSSSLKSLDPNDIRSLLALEIPFFIAFSALWLFQTATTIAAAASAHVIATYNTTTTTTTVGSLHLKDLVLTWINSTYKRVLYAWLFALLAISAFVALFLAAFALLPQSNLLIAASSAVAALAYPYLDAICALGLVISVLEDSCRGARALQEAWRLIHNNTSRKLQTYILMLFLFLLSIPIYMLFYITSAVDDDHLSFVTSFPFTLVATTLFCLANYFSFVVFTLLYMEIKHANGGRVELQLGPGYSLVSSPTTCIKHTEISDTFLNVK